MLPENGFQTRKGTPIRRFKGTVGKAIGGQLYVHKNYAAEVIPSEVIEYGEGILKRFDPEFEYNCIMLDLKKDEIRFDECPDFDSAREPHVGNFIKIDLKGAKPPYKGYSDNIWHHKWLWVRDDYIGFDVDKSKNWSKLWLSKLEEPAKGTDASWNPQLARYGLKENGSLSSLKWERPRWSNKDEIEVELDVKKVDDLWSKDKDFYIGPGGTGNPKRGCYKGFQDWLQGNQPIGMPMISWSEWNKTVQFTNGRHRFAVLRDMGLTRIPALIPKEQVGIFKKYMTENIQLLMEARAKPKDLEAFLRDMVKGSEWEGKVFLVGGFVRDELLGKEPKDADIVVGKDQGGPAFNIWLAKKLGIYKPDSNPLTFPTFGTSNLRLDGVIWNGIDFTGETVDCVMFRKEQYHDEKTRKPTVVYTPFIEVDASRRDICFNAIYKDVSTGKILDPTGRGIADLKAGIVHTPIDPTVIYTDDALRMYRAVRIATQLDFELSPEVVEGIKNNLHRLSNTSRERVRDELNKILTSKNPRRGIELLRDVGLLPYVGKELQQMIGVIQNRHHKSDVFDHTMEVLGGTSPELVTRLIALFHDIGKLVTRTETLTGVHFIGHEDAGPEIAERIMRDLKYPLELIDAVKNGITNHMRLKHGGDDAVKLSDKSLRKFLNAVGSNLEYVLDVIDKDNKAHADASAMPNQVEIIRQRIKSLDIKTPEVTLPINGDDVINMGVKQGRKVGQILSAVTDAWFENTRITREEALAIVQRMKNDST